MTEVIGIVGVVQGHRDGHGFLIREDGEADIYLPAQEMHTVLHRDKVVLLYLLFRSGAREIIDEGYDWEILKISSRRVMS